MIMSGCVKQTEQTKTCQRVTTQNDTDTSQSRDCSPRAYMISRLPFFGNQKLFFFIHLPLSFSIRSDSKSTNQTLHGGYIYKERHHETDSAPSFPDEEPLPQTS